MINFTRILNYEYLSNSINNSYKHFITKDEEHPFVFDASNKKQDAVIGYFMKDEDKLIGIIFISPFHSKEAYSITYNFNIYIVKEYRGRMLGKESFDIFLKDIIKDTKIENLIVTVYQEQSYTIKWLLKNDFVQIGCLNDIDVNGQLNKNVVFLAKRIFRIEG